MRRSAPEDILPAPRRGHYCGNAADSQQSTLNSQLSLQTLPGFRDFYPDDCARRNYILTKWREVARRYGFVEYDGPILEPIELYKKKSGGELVGQLFDFVDKGERHVAMRPEMTPTLARMVAARERDFKKPLKWFCVPQFFRYEKQQRGRLREFYQLNCDIIGEPSPAADAELIAVLIDMLRALGLTESDFVVRLSSRTAWQQFFAQAGGKAEDEYEFFQIVDKVERAPAGKDGRGAGANSDSPRRPCSTSCTARPRPRNSSPSSRA